MASIDEFLAVQFERSRPGLELVSIEDAALPFSWVNLDVLAQERKTFPLLEEFTLRAMESGLFSEGDIGLLLGLEAELVSATVVDLMQRDYVIRKMAADGKWRIALTPIGMSAARELSSVTPVSAQIGFAFDRLRWTVTAFRRGDLVSQSEARERGLRILPGRPTEISDADFSPHPLNRMLAEDDENQSSVEILAVRKMTPKARLFLPTKLLIYTDKDGSEAQIGVAIDGELSRDHELEIERLGGADALGINVAPPVAAPLEDLSAAVISRRIPAEEVAQIRASVTGTPQASDIPTADRPAENASVHDVLGKLDVRAVSVHEHRGLLLEALNSATKRLLIIAPWVKRAVVDTDFLSLLERRLRQGVKVTIAHGYGPDDRGSDESAVRSLTNMQERFPDHLDLARLENTHAKILVWDDSWVLTSFNWLSFKGDPARTYRMEEGTLIRVPSLVDEAYDRYLVLVEQDRRRV